MKKLIIVLFSIMIVIASCKKDEAPNKNSQDTDNNTSTIKEDGGGISGKRAIYYDCVWDDDGNCNWLPVDCGPPAVNCLDDVVVTPNPGKSTNEAETSKSKVYVEFLNNFDNFTIPDFFTNSDYHVLFPELNGHKDVIEKIISGEIILHYSLGKDGLHYYIALPSNIEFNQGCEGHEIFVIPIEEQ